MQMLCPSPLRHLGQWLPAGLTPPGHTVAAASCDVTGGHPNTGHLEAIFFIVFLPGFI